MLLLASAETVIDDILVQWPDTCTTAAAFSVPSNRYVSISRPAEAEQSVSPAERHQVCVAVASYGCFLLPSWVHIVSAGPAIIHAGVCRRIQQQVAVFDASRVSENGIVVEEVFEATESFDKDMYLLLLRELVREGVVSTEGAASAQKALTELLAGEMESSKSNKPEDPQNDGDSAVGVGETELPKVPCGSHREGGEVPCGRQPRIDGRFNNIKCESCGAAMHYLQRLGSARYADGTESIDGTCTATNRTLGDEVRHCMLTLRYGLLQTPGSLPLRCVCCVTPAVPTDKGLPSARAISNDLMNHTLPTDPTHDTTKPYRLNGLFAHFGQFFVHDLDHTTPQANAASREVAHIPVPLGDPIFDPESTGKSVLRFRRSINKFTSDVVGRFQREQINKVTSYIDASMVYGVDDARTAHLRSGHAGMLRMAGNSADGEQDHAAGQNGVKLPRNDQGIPNDNPLARPISALPVAGDPRIGIQPGLLAMHTVFALEHNKLCQELLKLVKLVPPALRMTVGRAETDTSREQIDERLFQIARRILAAETQIIANEEYIPLLLGAVANQSDTIAMSIAGETVNQFTDRSVPTMADLRATVGAFPGYDDSLDPSISNEFSTAFFRFGHSQSGDLMPVMLSWPAEAAAGRDATVIARAINDALVVGGSLRLNESYFQPQDDVAPLLPGILRGSLVHDTEVSIPHPA